MSLFLFINFLSLQERVAAIRWPNKRELHASILPAIRCRVCQIKTLHRGSSKGERRTREKTVVTKFAWHVVSYPNECLESCIIHQFRLGCSDSFLVFTFNTRLAYRLSVFYPHIRLWSILTLIQHNTLLSRWTHTYRGWAQLTGKNIHKSCIHECCTRKILWWRVSLVDRMSTLQSVGPWPVAIATEPLVKFLGIWIWLVQ